MTALEAAIKKRNGNPEAQVPKGGTWASYPQMVLKEYRNSAIMLRVRGKEKRS